MEQSTIINHCLIFYQRLAGDFYPTKTEGKFTQLRMLKSVDRLTTICYEMSTEQSCHMVAGLYST